MKIKRFHFFAVAAIVFSFSTLTALGQGGMGAGEGETGPEAAISHARIPVSVKFHLADGVESLKTEDVNRIFRQMRNLEQFAADNPLQTTLFDTLVSREGGGISGAMLNLQVIAQPGQPGEAVVNRAVEYYRNQWKAMLEKSKGLGRQQRLDQIQKLNAEQEDLNGKVRALSLLNEAKSDQSSLLKEKLQQLRQEVQRLEMELSAKEARRNALSVAINSQKARVDEARQTDPIVQELQKLVKLRENEAQLKKQMVANGVVSVTESPAAEAQLSEARIRLAEREASLGKAGKGELMDRLTDELAMVSVDVTEAQLRLLNLRSQLKEYDPQSIDTAGLNRVMEQEPLLHPSQAGDKSASLMNQYDDRLSQIGDERFALSLADVEVTQTGAVSFFNSPIGANGFGGGRGRGGGAAGGRGGGGGRGGRVSQPSTQP